MLDTFGPNFSATGVKTLRRQIDLSVSRALVDGDYARLLLTDPSVAIEDLGCTLQQRKSLRSIRAANLHDFARQAQDLFWANDRAPHPQEDHLPLAAAAAL